jgi:hypothetical protein
MTRRWWLALLAVWTLSAVYVGARLTRGWVPHDEGTLAQSATRVLAGQWPHRDYDEIYTGGLAYLDALAFRVFGQDLVALRIPLFLLFLLWVPAVFSIAARFLAPAGAAAVTLLAVAWSLPNYPAAMPSWFNLFFATFGAAALLRFAETDRRRWLWVAGACAGLSCLAKIAGLYFLAAALLFLAFREQNGSSPQGRGAGRAYGVVLTAALCLFVLLLLGLVRREAGPGPLVAFVAPGALLAGLLLWNEWATPHDASAARFRGLWRLAWPLGLGFAVPALAFVVPYLAAGALASLWRGVFVAPTLRFEFARFALPRFGTAAAALPLALLFALAPRWSPVVRRRVGIAVALALVAVLLRAGDVRVHHDVWYSIRWIVPVTVAGGVGLLAAPRLSSLRREQLLVVLATAALGSLVQVPFAAPIYFVYAAPLAALAAAAVVASLPWGPGLLGAAVVAFYTVFAVRWVHPGFINGLGQYYAREPLDQRLAIDRGGLLVSAEDVATYRTLVATVQAHARSGTVYATPDCPEVPFLTGLRNPTRTQFDFFDEPAGRTARILATLRREAVDVVVINHEPGFSGPVPADLAEALARRYPRVASVDRFDVRWRP